MGGRVDVGDGEGQTALREHPAKFGDDGGRALLARSRDLGIGYDQPAARTLEYLDDLHQPDIQPLLPRGSYAQSRGGERLLVGGGDHRASAARCRQRSHRGAEHENVPGTYVAAVGVPHENGVEEGGHEGDLDARRHGTEDAFEVSSVPLGVQRALHLGEQLFRLFVDLSGAFCIIKAHFGEFGGVGAPGVLRLVKETSDLSGPRGGRGHAAFREAFRRPLRSRSHLFGAGTHGLFPERERSAETAAVDVEFEAVVLEHENVVVRDSRDGREQRIFDKSHDIGAGEVAARRRHRGQKEADFGLPRKRFAGVDEEGDAVPQKRGFDLFGVGVGRGEHHFEVAVARA